MEGRGREVASAPIMTNRHNRSPWLADVIRSLCEYSTDRRVVLTTLESLILCVRKTS
jgi:hypothetical protein